MHHPLRMDSGKGLNQLQGDLQSRNRLRRAMGGNMFLQCGALQIFHHQGAAGFCTNIVNVVRDMG